MTAAILLAALAGLAAVAGAQGFNDVYSKDGLDVWAVGGNGKVYRSFDSGANWDSLALGNKSLRGVAHRGLTVWVVGDSGKIWRSVDNGGSWGLTVIPGAPNLRGISMVNGSVGWIVGDGGTIDSTGDGGLSWHPQSSGTFQRLNAVRFTDALNGWAVGGNGIALKTADAGHNWSPISFGFPVSNEFLGVDASGSTTWIVGVNSTAIKTDNGGTSWAALNLHTDAHPDVRAVWVQSPDSIWIAGGGGFIRRSYNGGTTWTFQQHQMHGQISDLFFYNGANGWASSNKNFAVMRTFDRGANWALPVGTTANLGWALKLSYGVSIRGSTTQINPIYKTEFYVAAGGTIYRSTDEGETWSSIATIPTIIRDNGFLMSPKDSNVMVVAGTSSGGTRELMRTTNYGASWTAVFIPATGWGEYGDPIAINPDKPDTMYFGPDNDVLYRSIDAGKSWSPFSTTSFRSPCDIVVVPESDSSIVYVGDGITGSGIGDIWRSKDGGVNFLRMQYADGSEIPGMAVGRLRPTTAYSTSWNQPGPRVSMDNGLTWPNAGSSLTGVTSTWGTDVSRDDPNIAIMGRYAGTNTYLTRDGGTVWNIVPLSSTNYSFFVRDRGMMLAEQADGMYKLVANYPVQPNNSQSVAVNSPNGGEGWAAGSVHNITWNATNIGLAHIEYRRSPSDPWIPIADVEGNIRTYAWSVPDDPTTTAEVRVSDAWDASPSDVSNSPFSILAPRITVAPPALAYGSQGVGSTTLLSVTVTSTGTAPLAITSVTTATTAFTEGRSTINLASGGASDTVGVTFRPSAAAAYTDTLVLTTNVVTAPIIRVPLSGSGSAILQVGVMSPNGGEAWQYNHSYNVTWSSAGVTNIALEWQDGPAQPWQTIAAGLPASPGTYSWTIPNDATTQARVRVRQIEAPGIQDVSNATFSVTVPQLQAASPLDFGGVYLSDRAVKTMTVSNPGTALLTVSMITSNDKRFTPTRNALSVPAAGNESLSVTYQPTMAGDDTTSLILTGDDPTSPHVVLLKGEGGGVGVGDRLPTAFALSQNIPNPFTGVTRIRYALPRRVPVSLEVFNLSGQRVATLVDDEQEAGEYSVNFGPGSASGLARVGQLRSGLYFYRLKAGEFSSTRRLLLVR